MSAQSNTISQYGRIAGENTSNWLERLIAVNAPADIRANVQQILATESAGKRFLQMCNCCQIVLT